MFLYSRNLHGQSVRADIVIVGSGAAGLTLANQLGNAGADVLVVETGGLEHSPARKGIDKGDWTGDIGVGIASRSRYLGGSTNCWGGNCAPMDDIGYDDRPWVPHSGWPIDNADLEPFVKPAHELLRTPFDTYDVSDWADLLPRVRDGLLLEGSDAFETKIFQRSRVARFGELLRRDLDRSQNVRVLLDTNVVKLMQSKGRISHLLAVDTDQPTAQPITIEADRFILAAAIENSRLLLTSNVGNEHDVVGRYFMGHFHFVGGRVEPSASLNDVGLYTIPGDVLNYVHGSKLVVGALRLAPEIQRSEKLLDAANFLLPFRPHEHWMGRSRAAAVGRGSWARIRGEDGPSFGVNDFVQGSREVPSIAAHTVGEARRWLRGNPWYGIRIWGEQAPHPENRLLLGPQVDRFGLPRIQVRSSLTHLDKLTLKRNLALMDEQFEANGLGRVIDELPALGAKWPRGATGTSHFMGGTRMHNDPTQGVVDSDCKVHGVDNLYVAGASVFPTSGLCMATYQLTLMAFRLADHIERISTRSTAAA